MRVAVDAHAIGTRAGGNETYVRALLLALRDHADGVEPIALQSRDAIERGDAIEGIESVAIPFADSGPLRTFWGIHAAVKSARADLLHAQYFVSPTCPVPCVVSIHDVAWRICPKTLPPLLRTRLEWTARGTLRRAKRVFVLTHAVQQELATQYDVPSNRVDVVSPYPEPIFEQRVSNDSVAAARKKYKLPDDYVFYCGAMNPRKNLVRLARAILANPDAPPLVIAGPQLWRADPIRHELERVGEDGRVRLLDYVDREDLPALMRAANVFAYIPIYEGFGLPVLEALATGARVLASDIPSLREVGGAAAHYCDPLDEEAIRQALTELLHQPSAGASGRSSYTSEAMAEAASAGYRKALA